MSETLDETIDDVEVAAGAETDTSDEVARADEPEDVAAPAPAPIDWNDPELQARIAQQSQQETLTLLERLGVVSFDQPQPEGPPAPDPLSDTYAQDLEKWFEAKSAAQNAPFQEYVQTQQKAQNNAVIDGELSAAAQAAKIDDADTGVLRSLALHFAEQPEYARYGATIEGVQATAKAAAEWVAARDKAKADAAVLNYRKQIGEIQDTPAEPSAGGGGGLGIEQKPKTYDEIIAKYTN